jgi:hypothetical protein
MQSSKNTMPHMSLANKLENKSLVKIASKRLNKNKSKIKLKSLAC